MLQSGLQFLRWMNGESWLPALEYLLQWEACLRDKEGSGLSLCTFFSAVLETKSTSPIVWYKRGRLFLHQPSCVILEGPDVYFFNREEEKHRRPLFLRPFQKSVPALQLHWQTAITILTFPNQLPLKENRDKCCYSQPNNILGEMRKGRFVSAGLCAPNDIKKHWHRILFLC